ncbi:MAG: hypothetical protein HY248_03495, partial [Fimbriimonas ginsengisoli]|nr:hypothetical protein [Fimbriimonas ginsengisoli]
MRRIVLVVPGLVGGPDSESVLRHRLPAFERMAEIGALCKVSPIPLLEAPEALWLGLPPSEGQLRQGPLTVAALGADPPARSTHFHVSPLALVDGRVMALGASLTETEARQVVKTAKRLNTSSLTFVAGDAEDHGLVWESLVDMVTRGPTEAVGKPISTVMPEGDGDRVLR